MKSVYMSAYDINSYVADDDVLSRDRLKFDSDKPFFLICNIPIKDKTMFEFTVQDYYPIADFRHIPLYVGVSKQISTGILAGTFSVGSIYYDISNPKYDIMSNHDGAPVEYHQYIDGSYTDADGQEKVGCRKPGIMDTIGVGVNLKTNTITFFVNYTTDSEKPAYNKPFYSFHPPFDMKTETGLRFCIWSDIYYKQITDDNNFRSGIEFIEGRKHIKGYCNFGETGLKHPVPGYTSLYSAYYAKYATHEMDPVEMGTNDAPCTVTITGDNFELLSKDIDADVHVENELDPIAKNISLVSDSTTVDIINKTLYKMPASEGIVATTDYGDTNSHLVGSNIYINYPIPKTEKIYFEYTVKESQLKPKTVGIPMSMGITSIPRDPAVTPTYMNAINPGTIMTESIRMNLYRGTPFIQTGLLDSAGYFQYHIINDGLQNSNANNLFVLEDIETSVSPEQGSVIGVCLDLANNTMKVIIDGIDFTKLKFPTKSTPRNPFTVDVNKSIDGRTEYAYFFIHDEGAFTGRAAGKFNFGETTFSFKPPKGYTTLWDFYNVDKRRLYCKDWNAEVLIKSEKMVSSYLFADLRINTMLKIPEGMNRLIDSDNIIEDKFPHYYDINTDFIPRMLDTISRDYNGYIPEHKENSIASRFEGVKKYRINIAKYSNQKIIVYMNGKAYEDSFDAPENALIKVRVVTKSGLSYAHFPGTPNISKAIVGSVLYITATPATYAEYTVNIAHSDTQKIVVHHYKANGIVEDHEDSFIVTSRYPHIKAEITEVKPGFNKGTLNITEIDVSHDIIIYASLNETVRYKVTVLPTVHQYIKVVTEGITRTNKDGKIEFTVGYKRSLKVLLIGDLGYIPGKLYYTGADGVKHSIVGNAITELNENITIDAGAASADICTVEMSQVEGAISTLYGYDVKISPTKYQTMRNKELTVSIDPKPGYYLDYITIETK